MRPLAEFQITGGHCATAPLRKYHRDVIDQLTLLCSSDLPGTNRLCHLMQFVKILKLCLQHAVVFQQLLHFLTWHHHVKPFVLVVNVNKNSGWSCNKNFAPAALTFLHAWYGVGQTL